MTEPSRSFFIASLLNPDADKAAHQLWQYLEQECDLRSVRMMQSPHFSWAGARAFQLPTIQHRLKNLAARMKPFRIQTSGLGLFTSPVPVLYLTLVKTRTLMEFHERVWNVVLKSATAPNIYYSPEEWVPHITLAYRDLTDEKLSCAITKLNTHALRIDVVVDHLVLVYTEGETVGLVERFDFNN